MLYLYPSTYLVNILKGVYYEPDPYIYDITSSFQQLDEINTTIFIWQMNKIIQPVKNKATT